jgi:2-oxoisovalerate dehydrogenase E1 component
LVYPYYRDRALCLQLGMTPLEQLLSAVGAEAIPIHTDARCRRTGATRTQHRFAVVADGTQLLQAVGCAEASYRFELMPNERTDQSFHDDEVTYVSLGDGTPSEGEFWEALNTASQSEAAGVFLLKTTATRSASR